MILCPNPGSVTFSHNHLLTLGLSGKCNNSIQPNICQTLDVWCGQNVSTLRSKWWITHSEACWLWNIQEASVAHTLKHTDILTQPETKRAEQQPSCITVFSIINILTGTEGCVITSQLQGHQFDPDLRLLFVCNFTCSPCVCVVSFHPTKTCK